MISPFKSGLLVAAFALIFNALADSGLIYMLKPLLDDGFGKADHFFLENDGVCCSWHDYIAWCD